MLRWVVGGVLAAVALALPAPAALAAEERCPGLRGASGVVDWGFNASEQLGASFASNYENTPQTVAGLTGVTQVRAGFKFGLALLGNCTVRAWGTGNKGQLGDSGQQDESHPVAVTGLSEVREIAVANAHAMALLYNGTVWTWGASEFGERGNREKGFERTARQNEPWFVPRDRPTQVPGLSGVQQIAAGGTRDYALLSDGEVMAWGDDRNGELGVQESGGEEELCYGETHAITPIQCSTVPRPVKVSHLGVLTGVERIGAGEETAYAVRANGRRIVAWGAGGKGQLGDGSGEDSSSPVHVQLEAPSPVMEIAAGAQHTLARLQDGEVYAWGSDGSGQLGFETGGEADERCGSNPCSLVPQPVLALGHVTSVAAAEGTSFAVAEGEDASRIAYSFGGTGPYELLGLGQVPFTSTSTPTAIGGLAPVREISSSTTTAVALLEQGSGPAPLLALKASESSLTAEWRVPAEAFNLRYTPVGRREFSPPHEGSCQRPCSLALTGLSAQPYEIILKTPEGKEGREKSRKAFGQPVPANGLPQSISPPTITGSPATETGSLRLGQTLTVSPGSWSGSPSEYRYQWLRCEGLGEAGSGEGLGTECEPITVGSEHTPASSKTYQVQSQDVASSIIARVEAINAAGASAAVSTPEIILAAGEESEPPYPTSTARPTIAGAAVEGRTLTARHGSWENSPTSELDKWYRCKGRTEEGTGATCTVIKNGEGEPLTGETYVPSVSDVGLWIEVQERATNPGGWEVATSEAVQIAPPQLPANLTPPSIEGSAEQGRVLRVEQGSWSNAAVKPAWQWYRCSSSGGECSPISRGTGESMRVTAKDVLHTLKLSETVENGVGRSEPAFSALTQLVPKPPAEAPVALSPPTVSGAAEQGHTLTAHAAEWSNSPKSFEYQWRRCEAGGVNCQTIKNATGQKYELRAADVGFVVDVREAATNAAGTGVAVSSPTHVIAGAVPVDETPPTITGYPQQGRALAEFHGHWDNEPLSYSYQWERCNGSGGGCEAIAGAESKTYSPKAAEVGATLRVEEVASNATGHGAAALSDATAPVALAAPVDSRPPTVSGVGAEGETLTAHPGSWHNSPTRRSYQWLRCEQAECTTIEGATKSTYVVGLADVGFSVAVREAAGNAGGWEAALSEGVSVGGTPLPFVTGLEPDSGPVEGGTSVTISGGNFQEATGVSFGFAAASSYEILSPDEIRAVAPAASAGTVDVTVTTAKGTSAVGPSSRFRYGEPPALSAIAPREGPEAGGTSVTLTGSGLAEASSVKFGISYAQSFGVQSEGEIIAIAPPGTGTVPVTVTTPYGTSTAGSGEQFTYVQTGVPPQVRKLSAKKGPAAGGTTVLITGEDLTYTEAVRFGATGAASFKVLSQESIEAVSPPHASGTYDVTLTTPYGTSATSSHDHFRFEDPIVSSLFPESGPLAGGTVVTVTGAGFAPGEGQTAFKFGKTQAAFVECESTARCTLITPADSKAQTVEVKASAGGKSSSSKDTGDEYTYE